MKSVKVSTPSRICLFGEHLDYLHLEVIAMAIDIRFSAEIYPADDQWIKVNIFSENFEKPGDFSHQTFAQSFLLDYPYEYTHHQDFIKSTLNVIQRHYGQLEKGFQIDFYSQVPIGKGMSSSSTLIVVLIKAILEMIGHEDARDPERIAYLAYLAEVKEFNAPGGMMDQYSSALGGLLHLDFSGEDAKPFMLNNRLPGVFILFDSLQPKDTIRVLSHAKKPVVSAMEKLKNKGVQSLRDLKKDSDLPNEFKNELSYEEMTKLLTAIDNYSILNEALVHFQAKEINGTYLGELLSRHHRNLSQGLGISTPEIEAILTTAKENGAWGGKINGSGGGGCCFVYCPKEKAEKIKEAVSALGFPGRIIHMDKGVRCDES